ncbi:GTPase-GDP dissociation stimulator vimar [Leptopilina boulardi]|uniref:GTPase-GDP dissociation stimulator vimar n=1 Tax=Leptopilina boulardi TaxID=63433 RepID=UPI0021F5A50F|nr:GTPase-GDP dissociation stimulator vimar [Leptopilina boulardi]
MEETAKNQIGKFIHDLKEATLSQNIYDDSNILLITEILDSLVNISKIDTIESVEFINDQIFLKLLTINSETIATKTAKTIAEIAKTECGREKCTREDLVRTLIELLQSQKLEILIQASRALGNICYENAKGKALIREKEGLKHILKVVEKGIEFGDKEGADFLRNVAAGFLLNFLVDQNSIDKEVIKKEVVTVICKILEIDGVATREAAMQALLILGVLNDYDIQFLNERLANILVEILKSDNSSEFSEMCLEVLHGQADDENAKLLLAKVGVCELLLKLLEKHGPRCTDEETRSVLKIACNLIVLILTGDESMNLLYKNSEGFVYKKLVEWLENLDEDLQVTAVLAMGNFARADKHCELMVAEGVDKKLLKLIMNNNSDKCGDIRFQHDLLSAMRNLVISPKNKSQVLADGLIQALMPMLDIPTFPVVFKLLGTLRIVIGGQQEAAILLGKNSRLIEKAVEWSGTEDHPGVHGEANRLLAWLIINSRDKDVVLTVINNDGVKRLVKMLNSKHQLMQNEALLSLNILTAICLYESEKFLIDSKIGLGLFRFIKESAPTVEPPIIYNSFSLMLNLVKSKNLKEHLMESQLPELWKELIKSRESDLEIPKDKMKILCVELNIPLD